MSDLPIQNQPELDNIVKAKGKVCVLFYASWCHHSQRFLPIFKRTAGDRDCYARVEINDDEALAEKYGVKFYPTVIFFENGRISQRLDGISGRGLSENQLARFIKGCGL